MMPDGILWNGRLSVTYRLNQSITCLAGKRCMKYVLIIACPFFSYNSEQAQQPSSDTDADSPFFPEPNDPVNIDGVFDK